MTTVSPHAVPVNHDAHHRTLKKDAYDWAEYDTPWAHSHPDSAAGHTRTQVGERYVTDLRAHLKVHHHHHPAGFLNREELLRLHAQLTPELGRP